jgi:hypothetical protein
MAPSPAGPPARRRTYQRVTQAIRLIRPMIGDYGGEAKHVAGVFS